MSVKALEKHQLIAAFVPGGSLIATGSMASFTKDLTPWLLTAPTEAIAVVLIGFPDLEPATTTTGGGPLGPGYTCKVSPARTNPFSYLWEDGTCADFGAGFTRVRQMTHCEEAGTIVTLPTYGIALTSGRVSTISAVEISGSDRTACEDYAGADACNAAATAAATDKNITYTGIVTMNNIEAANYACGGSTYYWAGPPGASHGLFGPWGNVYNQPYRDALCCATSP
ncbi:MAG: hypothetical protein IPG63_07130 [Xanthomonadales bacterium]|nr:hypothetical protein [Xanthomonadales bacterium]